MVDRDLAEMYGVETRRLNEQVKRNEKRFPDDFMFQLTERELEDWKSHSATSNREKMGLRKITCTQHLTADGRCRPLIKRRSLAGTIFDT